ncbi:Ecto-NOX disulfide-thiol exchanger 1 [Dissostichus eleginoides]|uniref:Ecto-NOX disulfide-thiol exchanger 1 n=1 Tax=Dissostichus eleginoides TaxID=100907 RepID=A0AAD9CIC1_DISEL|nr:Ecto-NOX disulfide-thiol exchanger 1 [Dissostichus eleginoides]
MASADGCLSELSVPVSEHRAWATAMNNLGILPVGLRGPPLLSDSVCIQRFDPGLLPPINPLMGGPLSLVPPPPCPPDMPIIKEIIHCPSCTLFPQNPNLPPPSMRERPRL